MKIRCNAKTTRMWSVGENSKILNLYFISRVLDYVIDQFNIQGYIYLNTIYETIGIEWDPHNENICWIKGEDELVMSKDLFDEDIVVTIN